MTPRRPLEGPLTGHLPLDGPAPKTGRSPRRATAYSGRRLSKGHSLYVAVCTPAHAGRHGFEGVFRGHALILTQNFCSK